MWEGGEGHTRTEHTPTHKTHAPEIVLEEVHHLGHLREDEHAVAPLLEPLEHAIHEPQLPAGLHQHLRLGRPDGLPVLRQRLPEEERVVAHLWGGGGWREPIIGIYMSVCTHR